MKNYLIEKQNDDGSYSDIAGFGSIFSTFEVIETLDQIDKSFVDSYQNTERRIKIGDYLNNSLNRDNWGFRAYSYVNDSDIITTSSALQLAQRFSFNSFLNSVNIKRFINSTFLPAGVGAGYSLTNNTLLITAESTYYGILAFLATSMNYSLIEKGLIYTFISSLYNSADGGYREPINIYSDIQSTYFSLSILDILGYPFNNATKTLQYVLNCQNADGGFVLSPGITNTSDFKSGWAAIKSLRLIKNKIVLNPTQQNLINQAESSYYNWLNKYQALNTLFGQITVESNYFGILGTYIYDSENLVPILEWNNGDVDNILAFISQSYNSYDGGFGSQPNQNASLFATYCALNIYEMLYPFRTSYISSFFSSHMSSIVNYLASLQNPDGGFKAGNDVNYIASLFSSYYSILINIINENVSTIESTFWALASLNLLDAMSSIDMVNLTHWVKASQNADGGFSIVIGFHSDVISTYYGLQIFNQIFEIDPMSKMAAIEFLMKAQNFDGSFSIIPILGSYMGFSSNFLVTYMASKSLYNYRFQPEKIEELISWYGNCFSQSTFGFGDNPGFGGDLRNVPYAILIIDELKVDQSFDSKPWNRLLIYILIVESGGITLFILYKIYQKYSLLQKIKSKLGWGSKLSLEYLQQFPAINCENLNIYAGRKLIVDSVSLKLEHGKILGILGESGAGKSTFVKGLLGMRKISGFCQIYGFDMNKRNAKKIRPIYGYVPQDLSKLYHNFTVMENLLYFGGQYGLIEKEIISRGRRILRSLEISDKENELVKNLSGGQKRRVSIAVGLIHEPIFLILDEPTSGLDPIIRENLWLTLTKINEQYNTTLIVITHYPEESRFCHYVAIFGRKRGMIDFGRPKELLEQLPGKGRSIEVTFKEVKENVIKDLERLERIDKVLENKAGTDYSIFTDLNLEELKEVIENIFGENSIELMKQIDAKMEQYFRYKAMEVPKIEEL
ncbi:MAG: prenyltransferase/squalene oxidase repeat-containing protein [Promethearchaeota archaeon]